MGDKNFADDLRLELARRIRSARRSIDGLKQSDVVEKMAEYGVEMGASAYAKLERGERGISFVEAAVLTKILAIDLSDLVPTKVNEIELLRRMLVNVHTVSEGLSGDLAALANRFDEVGDAFRGLMVAIREVKQLPLVEPLLEDLNSIVGGKNTKKMRDLQKTVGEVADELLVIGEQPLLILEKLDDLSEGQAEN